MISDLDYFHESTLYDSNVDHFCKSLPSHLRKKFEKSLHVDIIWGNILHGYRGPSNFCDGSSGDSAVLSPSHGLTEIKFQWGMRKWVSGLTLGLAIGVQAAIGHYQWSTLFFDSETGECLSHDKNEAIGKLNDRGDQLFKQGNFVDATEYYNNAYQASSFGGNQDLYEANRQKAQMKLDAMNLSSQVDDLYVQSSDLDYFYENTLYDYNVDHFCKSLPSHLRKKFEKSLHVDIIWGNILHGYRGPSSFCDGSSGDSSVLLPSHGLTEIKFQWGMRKWISGLTLGLAIGIQMATGHYKWSSLFFDSKTGECLSHDKNEAIGKLNDRGDQLFEQENFVEAAEYYNNAYQASSFDGNQNLYEANRQKAQIEIDAMNLSSQADDLFEQGRYSEAENKYQKAYNKSQIDKKKHRYCSKNKKVQTILNKLSTLDDLWQKAWEAENDTENDRGHEAEKIFQTVLRESINSLQIFPSSSKLKEYEKLVSLKIEGNQVFNEALELQQSGMTLFQEAQKLGQQEKYKSAKIKFKEAKNDFCKARVHFEMGSKTDQRFAVCIDIVQEQLNEVIQFIENTECVLNARLIKGHVNISHCNNSDANLSGINRNENHNTYHQQI